MLVLGRFWILNVDPDLEYWMLMLISQSWIRILILTTVADKNAVPWPPRRDAWHWSVKTLLVLSFLSWLRGHLSGPSELPHEERLLLLLAGEPFSFPLFIKKNTWYHFGIRSFCRFVFVGINSIAFIRFIFHFLFYFRVLGGFSHFSLFLDSGSILVWFVFFDCASDFVFFSSFYRFSLPFLFLDFRGPFFHTCVRACCRRASAASTAQHSTAQ